MNSFVYNGVEYYPNTILTTKTNKQYALLSFDETNKTITVHYVGDTVMKNRVYKMSALLPSVVSTTAYSDETTTGCIMNNMFMPMLWYITIILIGSLFYSRLIIWAVATMCLIKSFNKQYK